MSLSEHFIPLHWAHLTNWGDSFAPLLAEFLSELPVFQIKMSDPGFVAIGSLVGAGHGEQAEFWGTGIITQHAKPNPRAKYHAVRGPLTRRQIIQSGGDCPEVYGDPGMLVTHVFPCGDVEKQFRLGIVPHWREIVHFRKFRWNDPSVNLINVATYDLEGFCRSINQCDVIITSSLHALITAHAYGIPAVWVVFSDAPLGDGIKFHDYFASCGHEQSPIFCHELTIQAIGQFSCAATVLKHNTEPLISSCPFLCKNKRNIISQIANV